jgi:hypothetical protein
LKKLTTWIVTQEHAEVLRGPLQWLKENHPHKRYRVDAANILQKIRFEGPAKQLVLTMKEKETLQTLHSAFPEACTPPQQLRMHIPEGRPPMDARNRVDRDTINLISRHAKAGIQDDD